MKNRRVVITGLGMVSPVGNTVSDCWNNVINGQSGIKNIEAFDTTDFNTKFGGEVRGLDIEAFIPKKETKKMDLFIQYGLVAALQAFNDSGLEVSEQNADRIGVSIGSGIGGIGLIEENHKKLLDSGPRRVSPFFVPSTITNMISGYLSIMKGLRGPNLNIVTACTTGVHNIGVAARNIAYGDADVMFAGGAEHAITPLSLAGFSAARALSTNNDNPTSASRPWDAERDGFVMGDGAGVVVLEAHEHAKSRGANIYAELIGFGMSGDAHHITSPPEDGAGAALAMKNAINDAEINKSDIGYINAHGTSTPAGDVAESKAVRKVFADFADKVMVSSTKSMTGHLLGAAGAVEAIFTLLAVKNGVIPPTINLKNPSEGCDLDYVPNIARDVQLDYALCNSFGFGGTNGSLLFKKF